MPDVTLRYTDTSGDFQYSVSGVVRYLEYDTDGLVIPSASDTAIGWGVGLAVAMNVTDTLTLRAGLTGGDGIGGYIHGTPKSDPAFEAANGDLETIKSIGGVFGASLRVGPGAVNVSYSKTSVDLDDNPAFSTDNDTYEGAWVNYIWSPNMKSPISYGVEANWNKRETVDGKEGTASRLQAMIMVEF